MTNETFYYILGNILNMKKESLKTKVSFLKDYSSVNTTMSNFDLSFYLDKIKLKQRWIQGEPNSMILLKHPNKQIVLIAMHEGMEMESFQLNDSVTLQIIEGKLKFQTRKETITLEKDQILTFRDTIKYSMTTDIETVFLLTISNRMLQYSVN